MTPAPPYLPQDLSNNSFSGSLEGVDTDAEGTNAGGGGSSTGRKMLQGQGGVSDPTAGVTGTRVWELPRLQFLDLSNNNFEGRVLGRWRSCRVRGWGEKALVMFCCYI